MASGIDTKAIDSGGFKSAAYFNPFLILPPSFK
jgi:hypothetical protein